MKLVIRAFGQINFAHAAGTDFANQPVWPDAPSGRIRLLPFGFKLFGDDEGRFFEKAVKLRISFEQPPHFGPHNFISARGLEKVLPFSGFCFQSRGKEFSDQLCLLIGLHIPAPESDAGCVSVFAVIRECEKSGETGSLFFLL
jgi:hypothetical protein